MFDECYYFDFSHWDDCPDTVKEALVKSSAIICVVDFKFSEMLSDIGLEAIFVDPLYWMWDEDPIRIDSCRRYYALDFPGVKQKVAAHSELAPDDAVPVIVEAIRDNSTLEEVTSLTEENVLLVNFGGMQSPLGYNLDLAVSMSRCILEAALSENLYDKVLICGGGSPIQQLKEYLRDIDDERVTVKALPQSEFFVQLASCRTFITVPGLSIVYEALYLSKITLFILPLNYSQHRQSVTYKRILGNAYFISWDDLQGYETLPSGLPEKDGVELSFQQGKKFSLDVSAQLEFKKMLSDFLYLASPLRLSLNIYQSDTDILGFDGAAQLAREILSDISANI